MENVIVCSPVEAACQYEFARLSNRFSTELTWEVEDAVALAIVTGTPLQVMLISPRRISFVPSAGGWNTNLTQFGLSST